MSHVSLNTSKIEFKNKQLIKINYGFIEEKIQKIKDAYKSRIAPYKDLDKMDYGDIFELLFVGNKSSTFFLANTIFFLKNTSWNLDYNKFMDEYISAINQKNILIKKDEKDSPFITSVL